MSSSSSSSSSSAPSAPSSSRYAAAHETTHGPGDARPTALDIITDENLNGALPDKVVLITGVSAGIGLETAKALNATDAKLFLGVRNLAKGQAALSSILKPGHVELLQMDLNSLASIRAAAEEFLKKSKTLNVLINNAGVMATPFGKTVDGFETQFGVNHLAHFLLFQLLKPTLLASSTPTFHSRVVCVSSSGHRAAGIRPHDYNFEEEGKYNPFLAYGQSKTANIYMANEIERRYGGKGLHGLSLMPGGVLTNLQVHVAEMMEKAIDSVRHYIKSPEQGAATTVLAAVGKEWEGRGGRYLEDCAEGDVMTPGGAVHASGYHPRAYDEEAEKTLWKDSLRFVGVEDDT